MNKYAHLVQVAEGVDPYVPYPCGFDGFWDLCNHWCYQCPPNFYTTNTKDPQGGHNQYWCVPCPIGWCSEIGSTREGCYPCGGASLAVAISAARDPETLHAIGKGGGAAAAGCAWAAALTATAAVVWAGWY